MRRKSHYQLGLYLAHHYLPHISGPDRSVFLLGCVEPDHNPFTYWKGSLRFQWLRGHNYPNSRRYMEKLSHRLETTPRWSLIDSYSLGKLIHYLADAFTSAHNPHFPEELTLHRAYEDGLQHMFLGLLAANPAPAPAATQTLPDLLASLHREYTSQSPTPENDTRYILTACCTCMAIFKSKTECSLCKSSPAPQRRR